MKNLLNTTIKGGILALTLSVAGLFAAPAQAVTINFDDGVINTPIGGFYSVSGITFSNAKWVTNFGLPGTSGPLGLADNSGFPFFTPPTSPIVGVFNIASNLVSIAMFDVGMAGAQLVAYDSVIGGSVVSSDSFTGIGQGVGQFGTLSVSGPGILRIELSQIVDGDQLSPKDGMGWDNLTFQPVPEPSTMLLLGSGLAGIVGWRYRKQQA